MPYRLKPTNKKVIQVQRGDRWVDKFTHQSEKDARAQLYALNKNVRHMLIDNAKKIRKGLLNINKN